jgi:hypothetical protein
VLSASFKSLQISRVLSANLTPTLCDCACALASHQLGTSGSSTNRPLHHLHLKCVLVPCPPTGTWPLPRTPLAQHVDPAAAAPLPQQRQPPAAAAEAAQPAVVVVVVGMTTEGVMGVRLTGGGVTRGGGSTTTGRTVGTGAAGAWMDMETRSSRSSVSPPLL